MMSKEIDPNILRQNIKYLEKLEYTPVVEFDEHGGLNSQMRHKLILYYFFNTKLDIFSLKIKSNLP